MRQLLAFVLIVALCYAEVPLLHTDNENLVPNSYIVVFRPTISDEQMAAHFVALEQEMAADSSSTLVAKFNLGDFKGYSAKLSASLLQKVRTLVDDVKYIEPDQVMTANQACSSQDTTEWGLDRISERDLALDGQYIYDNVAGSGVDAYIIDTGIRVTHEEFSGGRAIWGANFADSQDTDCNGHGTHVAGTVGGKNYGVAKKATLFAVKVLTCSGSGTNTGVIQGVQWAATKASSRRKPSVANMSLGGGKSTALDSAVKNAIASGVTFVIAAGNSNVDACTTSPADVGGTKGTAITVGATTVVSSSNGNQVDQRASFSNFGTCLDVFAPGQLITSAWYTSDTAVNTISGTSMASPHVAGAVALYLSENNGAVPSAVKSAVASGATQNLINLACTANSCKSSPNKLLYSACS